MTEKDTEPESPAIKAPTEEPDIAVDPEGKAPQEQPPVAEAHAVAVVDEPEPAKGVVPAQKPLAQTQPVKTTGQTPPPGAPDGGIWGTQKYMGNNTKALACLGCLCFGVPGCLVLLCPIDERDAYKAQGRLYTADGKLIDGTTNFNARMVRS